MSDSSKTKPNVLRRWRLQGFSMLVRECTPAERATVELARDAVAVEITARPGPLGGDDDTLTLVIGSPIIGSWTELDAACSAITFATCTSPEDWATDQEREWAANHGQDLETAAYCHVELSRGMDR
jgi:hypothetical protein